MCVKLRPLLILLLLTGCAGYTLTFPPITTTAPAPVAPKEDWPPVARNGDWPPVVREFDGVLMVLVPPGCFMMGSDDGATNESPAHRQCFSEPFWIDKYEVTNAQYGAPGKFSGPAQPREMLGWQEAATHCQMRGARLPTEVEWEYAARGPDSWVYPWGNTFDPDKVVYSGNAEERPWAVGSRPGDVSWVGAYDMSGNVREWCSTIYQHYYVPLGYSLDPPFIQPDYSRQEILTFGYPYNPLDGREDTCCRGNDYAHYILRGGSWWGYDLESLRASSRYANHPGSYSSSYGFRCARPD